MTSGHFGSENWKTDNTEKLLFLKEVFRR